MAASSAMHDQNTLDFVTMGMFIVDEIHFKSPKPPEIDVLGGAGSWSVIGARLFRPPPSSRRVGWIVHRGSDFPDKLSNQIESWQTNCHLIDTPERLTTRGWNNYGDDEARAFKYMTPKLRIDQAQLSDEQALAKCFHLISTPKRCTDLVLGILERRRVLGRSPETRPLFVWEPVPDACCPEELTNALEALKYVDVVSPNHQELAAFFGQEARTSNAAEDEARLSTWCQTLLQTGFREGSGSVVVRCGERGVLWAEGRAMKARTLPSWHRTDVSEDSIESAIRVADPTGAGNAFLGGFAVGLLDKQGAGSDQLSQAVMNGVVAASFAIEQVGMPVLSHAAGGERWNGDSVNRRLEVLKKRIDWIGP